MRLTNIEDIIYTCTKQFNCKIKSDKIDEDTGRSIYLFTRNNEYTEINHYIKQQYKKDGNYFNIEGDKLYLIRFPDNNFYKKIKQIINNIFYEK